MTYQEYLTWLNNPEKKSVLLAIITGWDYQTSQNTDYYFANKPYNTKPSDSLPNTGFKTLLLSDFSFKRSINFFYEKKSRDDFGVVGLDNSSHELDFFLKLQFFHRPIKLLFGDPSWDYDDFLAFPLVDGKIEKINFGSSKLNFKIKNKIAILDKPIQENLISSTGNSNNQPIPLCFGQVSNITPQLVDVNNHIYQWNDGAVEEVTKVYDRGVELTLTTNYTIDNINGKITLLSRPAGTITLDGKGAKPSTYFYKTGDIIKYIISPHFSGSIDVASFTALDTEKPYAIGIYIDKRDNILNLIDRLLSGIGGYYFINKLGQFSVGLLKNPNNETPILEIFSNKIVIRTMSVKRLNNLQWRTKVKYQKNWTVQKDGDLAGIITDPSYPDEARVDFLKNEYRIAKFEDIAVVPNGTDYDLVSDPDAIETFLNSLTDAEDEAEFMQNILGQQVYSITFDAKDVSFSLKPGDIIKVYDENFNHFDLRDGVNTQILSIEQKIIDLTTKITGFFIYE